MFVSSDICDQMPLTSFAFDDDYSFGILQSNTHWQWFVAKCSKLTERFRYTPESVLDAFPGRKRPRRNMWRPWPRRGGRCGGFARMR